MRNECRFKILLVEDCENDQLLIQRILKKVKDVFFDLTTCETLKQASEFLISKDFDIILLDLCLTDSSGVDTLKHIHNLSPLPVVILTGNEADALALECLKLGAYDYLAKSQLDPHLVKRSLEFAAFRYQLENEKVLWESQLYHNQKMWAMGSLSTGIAHEINTPIQYIGDNIQFLKKSFSSLFLGYENLEKLCKGMVSLNGKNENFQDIQTELHQRLEDKKVKFLLEEIPKAIEESSDGIKRIAQIVQGMKEFSKTSGNQKLEINLNQSVENTLNVTRYEWKYVAKVVKRLDPELPLVCCVQDEINQVILNLVVNAASAIRDKFKQTEEKPERDSGTILISTRYQEEDQVVELCIEDDGVGIPKEVVDRMHDPFFTNSRQGKKETGQGLSIVHSIVVEKHNGEISIQTEERKGTKFSVVLPVKANRQESPFMEVYPKDAKMNLSQNSEAVA